MAAFYDDYVARNGKINYLSSLEFEEGRGCFRLLAAASQSWAGTTTTTCSTLAYSRLLQISLANAHTPRTAHLTMSLVFLTEVFPLPYWSFLVGSTVSESYLVRSHQRWSNNLVS